MNTNIMRQVSGGTEYDTRYAAGFNQDSSAGTTDVGVQALLRPFLALTVALGP